MRYEDLNELGRNHYSVVFAAHDFNTRRDVVIMELLPQFQSNPGRWDEIWQQVMTLSDAKLENTVPVYDLDRERRWVVMEKMNTALQAELNKGPLDAKLVRGVLRQILVALDSLHKQEIYHGDIKPANLLVNNEGFVRLSFSPGLVLGGQIPQRLKDFKYLCPEMLNPVAFGDIGPQSDLYCLGFTALELLIGPQFDSKFKGVTEGVLNPDRAWMSWHSSNQPSEQLPTVAKLLPGTPQDLVTVIDRLLQKEVKNRYQSAAAALADLERTGQDPVFLTRPAKSEESEPKKVPEKVVKAKGPAKPGFLDQLKALFAAKPGSKKPSVPVGNQTAMQKFNQYLEDRPALKYTVIGLVCLVFLMLLFAPSGKGGVKLAAVEVTSVPEKAMLTFERLDPPAIEEDKKSDGKGDKPADAKPKAADAKASSGEEPVPTPAKLKLAAGEYEVHLELQGYEKLTEKMTVAKAGWSAQKFSFKLKEGPAPAPTNFLPDGLTAVPGIEDITWEGKLLPKRALSIKLTDLKAPLEFALIMPKSFQYGVSEKDMPEPGELAASEQSVKYPYYISLTEVTNEQLQTWAKAAKVEPPTNWKDTFEKLGAEGKSHPAVHVGFATAKGFSEWLSKRGRLPTEKEWEFAARGTTGHLLPWESQSEPNDKICNLTYEGGEPHTVAVTALEQGRSPLGLAHLVGNAAEWCSDDYVAGVEEGEDAPGAQGSDQPFHATRGGSFLSRKARLTTRANSDADGAGHVGFRVLVSVQSAKPAATTAATKAKTKAKAAN
ncbi:MAG: serine/threonine protein kinase [Planctomycetaceae bacterium]|nr:serine/threonine protein kinase [Planctomycetaceae bacterium]